MTTTAIPIGSVRSDRLSVLMAGAKRQGGIFVEVGTYLGDFAVDVMEFCHPSKLYCVDPYRSYDDFKDADNFRALDDVFAAAQARTAHYGKRVEFLREFSEMAAPRFADASLDFVYIDGNHSYPYVLKDLEIWYPKLKAGGLLCGDDAVDTDPDSARDAVGDVVRVWSRDASGQPESWGHYGVLKALRDFAAPRALEPTVIGTQFLIFKPA